MQDLFGKKNMQIDQGCHLLDCAWWCYWQQAAVVCSYLLMYSIQGFFKMSGNHMYHDITLGIRLWFVLLVAVWETQFGLGVRDSPFSVGAHDHKAIYPFCSFLSLGFQQCTEVDLIEHFPGQCQVLESSKPGRKMKSTTLVFHPNFPMFLLTRPLVPPASAAIATGWHVLSLLPGPTVVGRLSNTWGAYGFWWKNGSLGTSL